jgi:hypothetical protein
MDSILWMYSVCILYGSTAACCTEPSLSFANTDFFSSREPVPWGWEFIGIHGEKRGFLMVNHGDLMVNHGEFSHESPIII